MSRPLPRACLLAGVVAAVAISAAAAAPVAASSGSTPHVLLVGTFNGIPGQYADIQSAVNAAVRGDWVLVAPGDYHTDNTAAGVYVTTPGIHLRGMDRNHTIVDGTSSAAAVPCDPNPAVQELGPLDSGGNAIGRNGIEVYKASGVTVENFLVCNFLSGSGHTGNEVWFNGGDGSGTIGMGRFRAAFLTASSSYFKDSSSPMGMYALFSSNASGPGIFYNTYGSNMGDSAYYIGACQQVCNQVIAHGHAQNSALGYSGTNAGGNLVIRNSEFDHNRAGIVPNSLNNDDAPPPQNGLCPGSTTQSCMIIQNNYVHDNNNPHVPGAGIAGSAPIGSGIELSGGQWDTVTHNRVANNGGWGIVVHDFPDSETPPPASHCQGGVEQSGGVCYFQAFGNMVLDNLMVDNGDFGNPTNGDLAAATTAHDPGNCFVGNARPQGQGAVSSDPPDIQNPAVMGTCGQPNQGDTGPLFAELNCAAGGFVSGGQGCPPGSHYPSSTKVVLTPIPTNEQSMPNPCSGVPSNAWCPAAAGPGASAAVAAAGVAPVAVVGFALLRRRTRRMEKA